MTVKNEGGLEMAYTKEDIINLIVENDVKFIRLQFTDIMGSLKNIAVTVSQLEKALNNQCMLDGSSIEGFAGIEESDMYLKPDLDTFVIFPWRPQHGKVARFICDIYTYDGKMFEGSPRYALKKVVEKAKNMGYELNIGSKCEFFLFQTDGDGQPTTIPHDKGAYLDLGPADLGENVRREICLTLEDMGYEIEESHHENAPGQHKIDFHYTEAIKAADDIMTMKLVVKTVAQRNGLFASFMPKPIGGSNGSGMHTSISMTKDGVNIFYDAKDEKGLGLSDTAYKFMAGVLAHAKGMTLITNPTTNSYKRINTGFEAPAYVAWSIANRSPLIRVSKLREGDAMVELRNPDAACNPYLQLAAIITAGLSGIEKNMQVPKLVKGDVNKLTDEERKALNIERLPRDLGEAIKEFKANEVIKEGIGKDIVQKYVAIKEQEWKNYQEEVFDWEFSRYFNIY